MRVNMATLRVSVFLYLITTSKLCSDALKNPVTKAPFANLPAMLVVELLPFVKNLAARKWSDEDILEDVNFLRDELEERFESLMCVPHLPCLQSRRQTALKQNVG